MSEAPKDPQKDFESFIKETRSKAGESYVNGDSASVVALTTRQAGSTFFGPAGGYVNGVEAVLSANEKGAKAFGPGGSNELEILQMHASGGVAYWIGIQHSKVRRVGTAAPVPLELRVTEVYRYEDRAWKLVHRHADTLLDKP